MSDIKMGDVFELPLQAGCIPYINASVKPSFDDGVAPHDIVVNVINSHDRLTAENEALREELERLQRVFEDKTSKDGDEGTRLLASDSYFEICDIICPDGGSAVDAANALLEEVERLRDDNDHQRERRSAARNAIEKGKQERKAIEQERDQLKDLSIRLAIACEAASYEIKNSAMPNIEMAKEIDALVDNAGVGSIIAAHDAKVIELAVDHCVIPDEDGEMWCKADELMNYANQLRQQARESGK